MDFVVSSSGLLYVSVRTLPSSARTLVTPGFAGGIRIVLDGVFMAGLSLG